MKKTIYVVLLVFFTGLLCYSAWELLDIFDSYQEGRDSYQNLEQYVTFEEPVLPEEPTQPKDLATEPMEESTEESTEDTQPEPTEGPDLSGWPQVDFEQLSQINPDVVGWIYIENTNINYPIVQGKNNDYYLRRLFDGTYNSAGCIFLDAACDSDFGGNHSIIYGHNMKNMSMFADLMKYKSQSFFEEHSEGLLLTPTAYYKIKFFSGYVSDNWSDAWELDYWDVSFDEWLENIRKRSYFKAENLPADGDRVLTLSTCSYEFDSAKYVLHGYVAEMIALTPAENG